MKKLKDKISKAEISKYGDKLDKQLHKIQNESEKEKELLRKEFESKDSTIRRLTKEKEHLQDKINDQLSLERELNELKSKNKELRSNFDKTLSKDKLKELIKDYPVKIHEERDELLTKVEKLELDKKELKKEVNEFKEGDYGKKLSKLDKMNENEQLAKKKIEKLEIDMKKRSNHIK